MFIKTDISQHSVTDPLHGHRHQGAYVALVLDGDYEELSADGAWRVEPGDIVVHPAYHFHANSFSAKTSVLNFRIPDSLASHETFQTYQVKRLDSFGELPGKKGEITALQEYLQAAETVAASEPGSWVDAMAQDLAKDSDIRISDLAQRYCVSSEHASRSFRRRYRMTAATVRSERRFRCALELLRKTRNSLVDIAHLAGYSDQPHFSRSCREITGLSPGKLRLRLS